jgi:hypothetical protein
MTTNLKIIDDDRWFTISVTDELDMETYEKNEIITLTDEEGNSVQGNETLTDKIIVFMATGLKIEDANHSEVDFPSYLRSLILNLSAMGYSHDEYQKIMLAFTELVEECKRISSIGR